MKISVLAAAAALTALLLAGCGGDNSTVATATTASGGASASSATTSSATTSGSGSSATTAESTDDADTTAPSFEGNSNNEFCKAARELDQSDLGSALSGGEGDLKGDLEKVQSAIDDLKDKAPSEIKDDVNTLAAGLQKIKDIYAKYDYDLTKLAAAAQKDPTILADITNADFSAAADRITAYNEQVCGITDDTTETT